MSGARFSVLFGLISSVWLAYAGSVELLVPGFEPQPLTADILGVGSDGVTTWLLQAPQPSSPYENFQGFQGSATLVEGPATASLYWQSPDGSQMNDNNCQLNGDGTGLCEDVLGFMGITTTFPVTLRAGVQTAFPVQVADSLDAGATVTEVAPAATSNFETAESIGYYYTASFWTGGGSIYGFASAGYGALPTSSDLASPSSETSSVPAPTPAPSGMSTIISNPGSSPSASLSASSGSASAQSDLNPSASTNGAGTLRAVATLAMLIAPFAVILTQI